MKRPKTQAEMQQVLLEEESRYERDCPESFLCMWDRRPVSCDFVKKQCEYAFRTVPMMGNPNGVLHGGMTACMLDNVMGVLVRCFSEDDRTSPTVDLTVHYILPIRMDTEVRVRARIVRSGANLAFAEAEVFEADTPERIAATASGTFFTRV